MNASNLKSADQNVWNGVLAFTGYVASSALSASLNPSSFTPLDGVKQWVGVVLTDNISDNKSNGNFDFHSLHVGPIGYDINRHDKTWGGLYSIISNGLTENQRFDMGFETILGLSLVKDDIIFPNYREYSGGCDGGGWLTLNDPSTFRNLAIPTSQFGYWAGKAFILGNDISDAIWQETMYQKWFDNHCNSDGTLKIN